MDKNNERDYLGEQMKIKTEEEAGSYTFQEAREKVAKTWGAVDMKYDGVVLMCTICSGLHSNGTYSADWSNSVIETDDNEFYKLYCKEHPTFYYDIDTRQKGMLILQGPKLLGHIGKIQLRHFIHNHLLEHLELLLQVFHLSLNIIYIKLSCHLFEKITLFRRVPLYA